MAATFDLIVTADDSSRTVDFRLLDGNGKHIAYRHTDLNDITVSRQQGLFDLRNFVRLYVDEGNETSAVAEIGVCIAENVLGEEILLKLWESESQRALRIQLPGATKEGNVLAAALARVPWEIARPSAKHPTLGERNLVVRIVHDMNPSPSMPLELATDEPLRVLFVFAESRGSRPLGARKERRELLRIFENEIYPHRQIVAHFLSHGVTRERLHSQVQENGGYHVVHWSGHGHANLLELCKPGGASDPLSGQELLDIFNDVGGFLPRLFFLSACHSGDILRVKDWNDFLAVAQGQIPETKDAAIRDLDINEQPGYTGTAHALLQGGVPSVVAMRYAVGDDYAREVAVEFYRALLSHAKPKTVSAALTIAQHRMLDGTKHNSTRFAVCDHATPILYGEEQPGITLVKGRSPALNPRNPRLHQIAELTTAGHEHFVGRTWELVGLGADFIGSSTGKEVKPVAVITGLGGMGKTALTAEALALWETRFEWVLLYQAKPNRLEFEATLRDIHLKLVGEEKQIYYTHIQRYPADAIYRDATANFTGPARLERLTRNLLRALKDEPILLVLDNFETNLKPADPATTLSSCQDPAWDHCLTLLAKELIGSPSRVLITCRRPLVALAGGAAHPVLLGPLPGAEAALFLKEHPALSPMIFGGDGSEKTLALRLLNASRFHPLLMDRLAKLAADAALRPQLLAALEALEKTKDFAQLPALFTTTPGDTKELAYLDDALASSLDQLIRDSSPDARRLLWIVAVANQPETICLVNAVWSGESYENERLRKAKRMLDVLPTLPAEMQAKVKDMPPKMRTSLDEALAALPLDYRDPTPLLRLLVSVGLVTEEPAGPEDDDPNLTCHELVRERIRAWMELQPRDRAELTENTIRRAFAEQHVSEFAYLLSRNKSAAFQAGSRALVYCVQAEAWVDQCSIADEILKISVNSHLLEKLIPHLQIAAESAPQGPLRWAAFRHWGSALLQAGHPDISIPFFEHAAAQARAVAEAGGEGSQQAWSCLAWIINPLAGALLKVGEFDAARQIQIEFDEANMNAGRSARRDNQRDALTLHVDIIQGNVEAALPEVRSKLAKAWRSWRNHCIGESVPPGPDTKLCAEALILALDLAIAADRAREDWSSALKRSDTMLKIQKSISSSAEDIAQTRINRANFLGGLHRFGEARDELESCLVIFRNDPFRTAAARSSLANLLYKQGDIAQAISQEQLALAVREQFPDPVQLSISHLNLANYLERSSTCSVRVKSLVHKLAALVYQVVARLGEHLKTSRHNYSFDFGLAHAAGTELVIPRVAELLDDPAFAPLEQWLRLRQVDTTELQAAVDQFLEQVRQESISQQ